MSVSFNNLIKTSNINPKPAIDHDVEAARYEYFITLKNRLYKDLNGNYIEICQFVQNNIFSLLSSAIEKDPNSLKIIADRDFLIAMNILNIELPREYINRFNRVYRAYNLNPSKNAIYNKEVADLLYNIALKMNKDTVDALASTTKLNEEERLLLVINRFSSTDERRNIRRTVRAMQHMSQDIMTEETIIGVFTILFNDQMSNLFCAVMTDKFDNFDDYNEEYVYSTVSNALLELINKMDVDEIKDILLEYTAEINKSGIRGRFSLYTINPTDYNNITNAIQEIEDMGIKVY